MPSTARPTTLLTGSPAPARPASACAVSLTQFRPSLVFRSFRLSSSLRASWAPTAAAGSSGWRAAHRPRKNRGSEPDRTGDPSPHLEGDQVGDLMRPGLRVGTFRTLEYLGPDRRLEAPQGLPGRRELCRPSSGRMRSPTWSPSRWGDGSPCSVGLASLGSSSVCGRLATRSTRRRLSVPKTARRELLRRKLRNTSEGRKLGKGDGAGARRPRWGGRPG